MTEPTPQQGPFDIEHVLLQWGGKLPGGEQWSCSLRLAEQSSAGGAQVPPNAEVDAWLHGALKDAVLAYHTRADTCIHTASKLSFVKANRINVEGHYMDPGTNEHVFADISGGGGSFIQLPNQCTVCVSLTTGFSRGPAHRGRFYLPMPALGVEFASGAIHPSNVATIVSSTKTFLEAIADVPGIDSPVSLTPSVMSRKLGAPAHRAITGVEVGRVVDTQRRRRKSLTENYVGVALDLGVN